MFPHGNRLSTMPSAERVPAMAEQWKDGWLAGWMAGSHSRPYQVLLTTLFVQAVAESALRGSI